LKQTEDLHDIGSDFDKKGATSREADAEPTTVPPTKFSVPVAKIDPW
jgi:hypothetical protein